MRDGAPVATDGPYPKTPEVLAGYTVVECSGYDRAAEIAAGVPENRGPG
ncbi:YciI family protein [Micromonospora sp. LOL_024]